MLAGIYVHIPFCLKKCRYCSFNSIPFREKTAETYLEALLSEIKSCRYELEPASLYIGGGTPTVLPFDGLSLLMETLRGKFALPEGVEATIEANPGTLAGLDLGRLKALSINRVSLGAQSFNPDELRMLGRLHGPEEVRLSVEKLKGAGIDNISLDLMYSLPGQDMASWDVSLQEALDLKPRHMSLYDLTLEQDTLLYSEIKAGMLVMPPEPVQVEMYLHAVGTLEKAGFARYEVSNFAEPGYECRHNRNYWSCGEYVGFGAGAHSHIAGTRIKNIDSIEGYNSALLEEGVSPAVSVEELSRDEMEREFIMLGLRRAEGISLKEYSELFGRDFLQRHGDKADKLEKEGYTRLEGDMLSLTLKGVLTSNSVVKEFF